MAKKVVSVSHHKKKKPLVKQNIDKKNKLKTIFKTISNYLKSDTYMFSPIAASASASAPSSSPSLGDDVVYEPMKKMEKKWLEEVAEYLKSDCCYMYAPIFQQSVTATATKGCESRQKADSSRRHSGMEKRTDEETARPAGEMTLTPLKRVVVKHVHMEQETVKRVLHQDRGSSFAQGKMQLQKSIEGKPWQSEKAERANTTDRLS